jgi:transcriptional/translational regulatory protein YebC/TACO1
VHRAIEAKGIKAAVAEVTWLPMITTPLQGPGAGTVSHLLEALEEHDDVKDVYSNAEFSE